MPGRPPACPRLRLGVPDPRHVGLVFVVVPDHQGDGDLRRLRHLPGGGGDQNRALLSIIRSRLLRSTRGRPGGRPRREWADCSGFAVDLHHNVLQRFLRGLHAGQQVVELKSSLLGFPPFSAMKTRLPQNCERQKTFLGTGRCQGGRPVPTWVSSCAGAPPRRAGWRRRQRRSGSPDPPFMGMDTVKSHSWATRRLMPLPSLPMTMAAGPFQVRLIEGGGAPGRCRRSRPPSCLRLLQQGGDVGDPGHRNVADGAGAGLGHHGGEAGGRRLGMMTPWAPAQQAVRITAPQVVGVGELVADHDQGFSPFSRAAAGCRPRWRIPGRRTGR